MSFICFEGIDNSGKTTLSKMLASYYSGKRCEDLPFAWMKEPSFSSDEADRLNLQMESAFDREALFLESKIRNQSFVRSHTDIIMDRYIVSGLVYSKVFSPSCYDLLKAVYMGPMFRQPDVHIFVDTNPEVCFSRGCAQPIEMLHTLRNAYVEEFKTYPGHVIVAPDEGDIQDVMSYILSEIDKVIYEKN